MSRRFAERYARWCSACAKTVAEPTTPVRVDDCRLPHQLCTDCLSAWRASGLRLVEFVRLSHSTPR